jgi:hypothetical protein
MDRLDHKGKPYPFDVTFYTSDESQGKGGQRISIKGAILTKHVKNLPMHIRNVDGFRTSKKPRHFENATRNISDPEGKITKVHIRLITHFNGHKVIW